MSEVTPVLRQFVIDTFLYGDKNAKLLNGDSFLEKGLVDSMGIMTLVSFVEEKYGIEVGDDELVPENWDSVDRIARFVEIKAAAKRA